MGGEKGEGMETKRLELTVWGQLVLAIAPAAIAGLISWGVMSERVNNLEERDRARAEEISKLRERISDARSALSKIEGYLDSPHSRRRGQ